MLEHKNLTIGEIWMKSWIASRKARRGGFIRMFPTPTIKKFDLSSIGLFPKALIRYSLSNNDNGYASRNLGLNRSRGCSAID